MKKKEIVKLSKYDELRNEVIEAANKEINKYKIIKITIALIGLIVFICAFIFKEYAIYEFFGGLALVGFAKSYKENTIDYIHKETKQKLRTIQDQEIRDNLRSKKQ